MIYIISVIALYLLSSFLKSPLKNSRKLFRKNTRRKYYDSSKKKTDLEKFRLTKTAVKGMLKDNFLYKSDPYQSYVRYRKNFLYALENYLLSKFPLEDIININSKIKEIENKNIEEYLNYAKTLV